MTLTLTILLVFSLASNLVLVWLSNLNNAKWMRMFSAQQGIPIPSMEGEKEKPATPTPAKERKKFSVPIPGADFMRKNPN